MKRLQHRSTPGQALVEFALVVPLFVFILLGLFDLGRAVFYYSTVANASREAVRLAIVDQTVTAIQQRADDSVSAVMNPALVDSVVTFYESDATTPTLTPHIGDFAEVRTRHTFDFMLPWVPNVTFEGVTTQQIEHTS
jgi:Flp pilus assembly protein TadG